jgi:hypothetical protein
VSISGDARRLENRFTVLLKTTERVLRGENRQDSAASLSVNLLAR